MLYFMIVIIISTLLIPVHPKFGQFNVQLIIVRC